MGLETATYISQLVNTNPVGSVDAYSTADDHLRLIKAVLQSQFPNFTAAAMNATVAELNVLDGYTGNTNDLNIISGAATGGLTAAELLYVAGVTSDIQTQIDGKANTSHTHAAADVTSGTFANARIAAGSVTQHVAAIDHDLLLNFSAAEHRDWTLDQGVNNINDANIVSSSVTQHQASIDHDALSNFVSQEHIRWDLTGAEKVHADRLTDSDISHDSTTGFVADKHVAHSAVSISAGTGLTGGGTIAASRSLALDTANTRNSDHAAVSLSAGTGISATGLGNLTATRTINLDTTSSLNDDHDLISITAGAGLTGGGTIGASRTLDVGAGTGISVAADSVGLDAGNSRNVDHSAVSITAGNGLTGGGTIAATRNLAVGAGDGITVNADDVAVDIAGLPANTGIDGATDEVMMYDVSAGALRRVTVEDINSGATGDVPSTRNLTAGYGLSGGGDLSADRTFTLDLNELTAAPALASGDKFAMYDISVGGSRYVTLSTMNGQLVHDSLSGFVSNEHIDHSTVSITAGTGISATGLGNLTASRTINLDATSSLNDDHDAISMVAGNGLSGGGLINANRTFTVGAGTGISVGATTVGLDTGNSRNTDHAAVSITAGNGLTGGGTIAANRTIDFDISDIATAITTPADADSIAIYDSGVGQRKITWANFESNLEHDKLAGFVGNEHIDHSTVSVTAGSGLTGGGTIAASRTINVGAGTGITVAADSISTNDGQIVHDSLSGFVADEHVAHGSVSITAGTGLTGGGTIAASRTINVVGGNGISAAADQVDLDISGLPSVNGNDIVSSDGYLIDDGGTMKRMSHQNAGFPVSTESTTGRTLAASDMNTYIRCTNAGATTITLNTGVGVVGNEIALEQGGTGQVTIPATATKNNANGLKTAAQYSILFLKCVATNTWTVGGDATT
jgi:hypothetical protein